jgi:hypothetical protein
LQPESDEDEGFSKVALGAGDISDGGVESDPGEVELVQQLLSTEQVGGGELLLVQHVREGPW